MSDDYYDILGVDKDASQDEIKTAYKKLAKQHHPDMAGEDADEEKFKKISEAYAVLSDEEKRREYDRTGRQNFNQQYSREDIFKNFGGAGGGMGGLGDIFNQIFGGQSRGEDLKYKLSVAFEDAAFGTKETISVPRDVQCETCDGTGSADGTTETCTKCNGDGKVEQRVKSMFGVMNQVTKCDKCNGTGEQVTNPCSNCRGRGVVRETDEIEVDVPAGVQSGTQLKYSGMGGVRDGVQGDLYIVVEVEPHDTFERDGADVYLDHDVSFATLALGGTVTVPTLDGDETIKVPAGTPSHKTFKISGAGIKQMRGYGQGDQYVTVKVDVPDALSDEQRELLEEADL